MSAFTKRAAIAPPFGVKLHGIAEPFTKRPIYTHHGEVKMKVALLGRVSTTRQENENQLLQLREFAASQNWEIIAEFVDTVTGTGKRSREKFDAMMLAASQHRFDLVLFWKLDRFSREGVRKTLRYLQQLDDWNVGWRSYTEPYFDSAGIMRDVVISIAATLAAQEAVTISERTKAGLARTRKAGTRLGRPRLSVDLRTVQKRLASGESLRGVARALRVSPALLVKRLKGETHA